MSSAPKKQPIYTESGVTAMRNRTWVAWSVAMLAVGFDLACLVTAIIIGNEAFPEGAGYVALALSAAAIFGLGREVM